MIELRHLRYFVAVAEEGHVTRAARRLGIQQPPLSQQIRALERKVGADLFHRLPRGVELTDAGRVLLEHARAVLHDMEAALQAVRRTARGEQGSLAIGFSSSAAFHPLVASTVRSLRESSPGVSLSLEEGSTVKLLEALRSERLDAAFVRSPPHQAAEELTIELIVEEAMLVALPHSARTWRDGRRRVELVELAEETFILYRRRSGQGIYDRIIAACQSAGFSPRIGQEAPRLVSTLSLVSAGLGISLIPASMARLTTSGVVYRRLAPRPHLTVPLYLAYRRQSPSGTLRRFLDEVTERRFAEWAG